MATRKFARDMLMRKHLLQPQRSLTSPQILSNLVRPKMVPSSSNGVSAFTREFSVFNQCSKVIKGDLERVASYRWGPLDGKMANCGAKRVDWGLMKAEATMKQVNGGFSLGTQEPKGTRSYSTSSGVKQDNDASSVASIPNIRPLSPHLSIYKPQSSSMVSIFFRISGIVLAVACCLFPLIYMKIGFIAFTYQYVYQMFFVLAQLIPIAAMVIGLALVYHTVHGIRHLLPNFAKVKA